MCMSTFCFPCVMATRVTSTHREVWKSSMITSQMLYSMRLGSWSSQHTRRKNLYKWILNTLQPWKPKVHKISLLYNHALYPCQRLRIPTFSNTLEYLLRTIQCQLLALVHHIVTGHSWIRSQLWSHRFRRQNCLDMHDAQNSCVL